MMRVSIAAAACAVLIATVGVGAQEKSNGFALSNPNAPISISADKSDADAGTNTLIYSGNVVVHQGEVRLHANFMRVQAEGGKSAKIDKIYAQGNVVIAAPSGTATGDSGVYDVTPRIVILKGNVVLTRDKNVMRGPLLTVNLITGRANLSGGTEQHGRIQGLFTPKSAPDEKK